MNTGRVYLPLITRSSSFSSDELFSPYLAVEHVLKHPHILNDATLTVSPYHVFNQPSACQAQSDPSLSCVSVSSDDGPESEVDILDSVQQQASPLTVDSIEIRSSLKCDTSLLVAVQRNM